MVTSKYPFAVTTKTGCEWKEGTVPNPSIKDEAPYRIFASEATPTTRPPARFQRCRGESGRYDDRTVPQREKRAKELGMSGYSRLNNDKLISKLRNHRAISAPG
jgi:hypothetical protein